MSEENVVVNTDKPKEPVPEYDMPIMHTHYRKEYIKYPEIVKEVGLKAIKEERAHWDDIGKNPSVCRKLYGIGHILNDIRGLGFNFRNVDNHCWLPQPNLKNNDRIMDICLNCGSLLIDNKFIPYTDLK